MSRVLALPSAYLSATSTARRLLSSLSRCQTRTQQAQANSHHFLSVALPFKNASMGPVSVQASHSGSVMAPPVHSGASAATPAITLKSLTGPGLLTNGGIVAGRLLVRRHFCLPRL